MSNYEEAATSALDALIDESPQKALVFLISNFVGLAAAIVETQGGDGDEEIKFDGGDARNVTIHAAKDKA